MELTVVYESVQYTEDNITDIVLEVLENSGYTFDIQELFEILGNFF